MSDTNEKFGDIRDLCYTDELTDEILIKILRFLPMAQWASLESLNRCFRENIFYLWKRVRRIRLNKDLIYDRGQLRSPNFSVTKSVLEKLILRAPNITDLSGLLIFERSSSIELEFFQLLSRLNFLVNLELTNILINCDEIGNFLTKPEIRSRLKKLILLNCEFNYHSNRFLQDAFENKPNIPPLQLAQFSFRKFNVENFDFFRTMDVRNLITLNVTDTPCSSILLSELIGRCTRLQHLECSLYLDDDYRILFAAISTCLNLTILKINPFQYRLRTDIDFAQICDWVYRLSQLRGLVEFSLLDFQFINDDVVRRISLYLPALTCLELYVDECTVTALTYLLSKLNQLKKLRLITMSGKRIFRSKDLIKALANTLIDLEYLHLTNPPVYSNIGSDLIPLKKLKELSFGGEELERLSPWIDRFGPQLESVELKSYWHSERCGNGLREIIEKIPNLRRLRFEDCEICDKCLREIAFVCPNLEELLVTSCRNISISSIQMLIDACPKLKRLVGAKKESIEKLTFGKYKGVVFE